MLPRIETVRIVAEKVSADGRVISQIVEDATGESVQNRETSVHNIPIHAGDNDMQNYNYSGQGDPIQNDACEGVPVLEPPSRADGDSKTVFCNVDGDRVPILEPPTHNVGKKIKTREQPHAVVNGDAEDSDVPVLEPPTYTNDER